jgi:membrane-associated phospholipid phosphatase
VKIIFHNKQQLLSLLALLIVSPVSLGQSGSKSMLVSAAIPLIGGAYSYTSGDYEGLKELGMSCLVTAHITTLLKNTVERTRPNGDDNLSFPSGHASAAFVGASYLHHRYGLNWGLPMYGVAAVISYQRVNVKDHYWSDVIAGAAIGYFSAAVFTNRFPKVWMEPDIDTENGSYGVRFKAFFD